MKFSRSTTYGLRALANLVSFEVINSQKVKSLKDIAEEENISLKYLEQLFAGLKKAQVVKSARGAKGGYYLGERADKINLLEVLEALGEKTIIFQCMTSKRDVICGHSRKCGAVPVLVKVQKAIDKSLKKMTLNDLI